jgi:hypothetical protein
MRWKTIFHDVDKVFSSRDMHGKHGGLLHRRPTLGKRVRIEEGGILDVTFCTHPLPPL